MLRSCLHSHFKTSIMDLNQSWWSTTVSLLTTPMTFLLLSPLLLIALTLAGTYAVTTLRYHLALSAQNSDPSTTIRPPPIPYTLPYLGSALSFLAPYPGRFWAHLFSFHPRSTGVCTLLLGGRSTHVLFSPSAVQSLFKAKHVSRQIFNVQVVRNGFGMEEREIEKFYGLDKAGEEKGIDRIAQQEDINHEYLLRQDAVNELTVGFTGFMRDELQALKGEMGSEGQEVSLYALLREHMFRASTTAFMGSRILEVYPTLAEDFFVFDANMLTMFFGIPRFLASKAYAARDKAVSGITRWNELMCAEMKGAPDLHSAERWEPRFGSRVVRARQAFYEEVGLNHRSRACMDLGFLFGLSSNAIPATGWMLMQILGPNADATLLPRVIAEIETAKLQDGTLDINKLIALPLLQSIFHETLRLYVDVLVTREVQHPLVLPIDRPNGKQNHVSFDKGSLVMAPSWLGHHDAALWTSPPCEVFDPERFLINSPTTGKPAFSTSNTNGKFFPFGGGRGICPGRVFAKQEVLASVATMLLNFDFEVLGFEDLSGKAMRRFPGLKEAYTGNGVMAMDGDMRVKMRAKGVK